MILRSARPDDARDVWAWRNDALARAMSLNTDEVPWSTHETWFARALGDPNRRLLIGERDGRKVGMVRFDLGEVTEVSISLDPACRGQGLGLALLQAGVAQMTGDLHAMIREENLASRRIFERAGFVRQSESEGVGRYVRPG
jgi:RimJ/RimL family protein N-acetyltransferase